MWRPGVAEIVVVLIIVILLFGPGRISKISKELGSSITAFKEGLSENKEDKKEEKSATPEADKEKNPEEKSDK